jgi:hypothetical protein
MSIVNGTTNTPQATTMASGKVKQTLYNVRDYGAKGDGTTDDTIAFNNANTAATSANGMIYAPHGTYMLNPSNINAITANLTGESMNGTIFKVTSGFNASQNLIRIVSVSNLAVGNFTVDGNKSNIAGGTQYGLYISTTTNCGAFNVLAQNWIGVGIHYYNNTRAFGDNLYSTANNYHGLEFEQNTRGTFTNLHGYSNTLHGILVDPGEVSGTGSRGNVFTNLQCDGNSQYGLAFNAANADVSAWLNEGDIFNNVSLMNNTQYGLNIYKQDKQTFNGLYIYNNGFFGIYLFETQYNTFNGLYMHNNSQAGNGSYDEILVEGYSSNSSHPSTNNVFNGGQIIIDGATKARYAFNEGTSHDGPNTFVNINIPNSGTSGKINQLVANDIITTPGGVVQIGDNGQAIQGANAGFDSAFSHILRLYNNFSSGSTQVVTPNGTVQFYVGGNDVFNVNSTNVQIGAGYKLSIGTGSNASVGTGTLSSGTVTISTTAVTSSSLIFLTDTTNSLTNLGTLTASSISAGVSFTVKSSNALDTSTFNWFIIN